MGYHGGNNRFPDTVPGKIFNVRDFGAVGDGEANDTSAINAALEAADGAGGGMVFIPAGKYKITDRILIKSSNTVLRGDGPQATFIQPAIPLKQVDHFLSSNSTKYSLYSWWSGFLGISGPVSISIADGNVARKIKDYSPSTEVLATVIEDAPARSRTFKVKYSSSVSVGDLVRFFMSDPGSTDLAHEMYSGQLLKDCPTCLDGYKTGAVDIVHFPSKVAKVGQGYITLEREVPWPVKLKYKAQIRSYLKNTPMKSGIENLTVVFPHTPAPQHHQELGYNGIYLEHAANCWVRNVEILNADNGIVLHNIDFSTVENVTIRVTKPRSNAAVNYDGHIGFGASFSNDVLIQDFQIKQRTLHNIAVRGGAHVVYLRGSGDDLNMDGHRDGPWATLFAHLDLGKGTRPYLAGGFANQGYPFGSFTTFYDLRRNNGSLIKFPGRTAQGQCAFGTMLNFIGNNFATGGPRCDGFWWLDTNQTILPSCFELPQRSHKN